ncbi:hypothetical protein SAY87_013231 [Trapa incisa]|uniref:ENTH domain-containing protein n=1 Tax=Trapa incisa TaxID=236973 RepID=A0AAN7KG04_9MYRT|nr:hypothetical protein SAY87_013231 [Trapa incisa]
MKLWKRAAGALKDHRSIWISAVSRRSVYRSPDLEAALIRATSHDESRVDYKNVQRVFAWVRTSPNYLRPFVEAISARMERTGSWPVALKGLMLMHGVFYCKVPAVHKIGCLPFDFSNFSDSHTSHNKAWGYNMLIRSYFAFLDHKSTFLYASAKTAAASTSMMADLTTLQEMQSLLDLLLRIKPQTTAMRRAELVLEAMDCVVIEIFNIYSKICKLIASVLSLIAQDSTEAAMALSAIHQANKQADELSQFFEMCRIIGVLNASEFPKVEWVPVEDIEVIRRVVDGQIPMRPKTSLADEGTSGRAVTVTETPGSAPSQTGQQRLLTTIVTDKWEVFDDDEDEWSSSLGTWSIVSTTTAAAATTPAYRNNHHVQPYYRQEIPDFITF